MTERKPAGMDWQSWIDRQIEQARARGEFDDLPGHGRPLADLDQPRDELWWVRRKLERENVVSVPPTVQLRRDHDEGLSRAREARSEAEVRSILEPLNERIRYANSHAMSGPPCPLATIDIDAFVARWWTEQATSAGRTMVETDPEGADAEGADVGAGAAAAGSEGSRRRWRWRRRSH